MEGGGWRRAEQLVKLWEDSKPFLHSGAGKDDGTAAATQKTKSRLNLHRVLSVSIWNILSLTEEHQLLHLANELRWLGMDVAELPETRKPGHGEISSGGYTYCLSWMEDGTHPIVI